MSYFIRKLYVWINDTPAAYNCHLASPTFSILRELQKYQSASEMGVPEANPTYRLSLMRNIPSFRLFTLAPASGIVLSKNLLGLL